MSTLGRVIAFVVLAVIVATAAWLDSGRNKEIVSAVEALNPEGKDETTTASNSNPGPPPLEASRGPTWRDRLAGNAKEAQLPCYVLHRTPIIMMGFYVVQWQASALTKCVVIVLGALVTTLAVYDIAVRRTWPTRFLFGLRPGKSRSWVWFLPMRTPFDSTSPT